jgi:hypothetical protein
MQRKRFTEEQIAFALLPDRRVAAHREHRLEQREEESREARARRRRKRAALETVLLQRGTS